ncbi:hypothetical protein BC829DRAFT_26344 [Chytridium lagenaria]|nr:hypothetical protein BC829DRAFT_26344 [Chytridium lagenaria]
MLLGVVMLLELAVGISERHYGLQKVIFNIARWYGIRVCSSITPCQAILSSSISGAFSKPISLTQAFLRCFFDIKDQLYDYYGKDSVIIKGAMISTVLWNIIVGNFDTGLHYAVDSRYFHTLPGLIVGADRGEIFIDTRTWDIFMSGFADDNESTMVRQSGGGVFLGSRPESIASRACFGNDSRHGG